MRVFAPVAFRYPAQTGNDYPYGRQDIADQALAQKLIDAGLVQRADAGPDPSVPPGCVPATLDALGNLLAPVSPGIPHMGFIGDSRLSQGVNKATVPMSTTQSGIPGLALCLSGYCVNVPDVGWQCVGGQRVTTGTATSETAPMSVQVTNAIASGIKNWTILMGTNDFDSSLGPVQTVAAVSTEYLKQIKRLLNAGCRVRVCTDPGVRTTEAASASKSRQVAILALNQWIRQLAYMFPTQVRVIDLHGAAVVQNSATASCPTAGYADSVHFLTSQNYVFAKAIAADWNVSHPVPPIFPRCNYENTSYDSTMPNKLTNGLFLLDTNADGYADSWGVSGTLPGAVTATPTVISAPSPGVGNSQHLVLSSSAAANPKWETTDLVSNIPNGSTFYVVGIIKVTSPVAVSAPRVSMVSNANANLGTSGGEILAFGGTFQNALAADDTFYYVSHPILKDSSFTTMKVTVCQNFIGAGSVTLDLMQFGVIVQQ